MPLVIPALYYFIARFSGSNFTKYAGINTVAKYTNRQNIIRSIIATLPTAWHNATKFGLNQVLIAITLASCIGISLICRIAAFSCEGLVKALMGIKKGVNENTKSTILKSHRQSGARTIKIYEHHFYKAAWEEHDRLIKAA